MQGRKLPLDFDGALADGWVPRVILYVYLSTFQSVVCEPRHTVQSPAQYGVLRKRLSEILVDKMNAKNERKMRWELREWIRWQNPVVLWY